MRTHPPAAAAAAGKESRDAQAVRNLLRSVGLREGDYEPLVVHQFLEVARRYAGDVLVEARAYADHAGRASLAADDVRLAVRAKAALSPAPPGREVMLDLGRKINTIQLPRPSAPHGSITFPPLNTMVNENYLHVHQIKRPTDQLEETEDADEDLNPKPTTGFSGSANKKQTQTQTQKQKQKQKQQPSQRIRVSSTAAKRQKTTKR